MTAIWIICPVTGRRWPTAKRLELKTCTSCGALIDIRHEPWMDGPSHVSGACPQPVLNATTTRARPTPPPSLTPTELLAEVENRRDRVHEAALERVGQRIPATSNGHPSRGDA